MDDDVDAVPLTTPIWTLDDLHSNFGITVDMLNEVTLKHPHAESWLRETSNTQNACIGGASMNVRLLFSRFADNLQIRDVLPSSAQRIAKSLLTTRGFVESCTPVVCVMKKVSCISFVSEHLKNVSRTFLHVACSGRLCSWQNTASYSRFLLRTSPGVSVEL